MAAYTSVEDDEIVIKGFDWDVTKRIASYLRPHTRRLIVAVIAMLFSVVANIATAPIIAFAIDRGIKGDNYRLGRLSRLLPGCSFS